jgi:hypothetical protein
MKSGQYNEKSGESFVCTSNTGYLMAFGVSVIKVVYTVYYKENVKNITRCSDV